MLVARRETKVQLVSGEIKTLLRGESLPSNVVEGVYKGFIDTNTTNKEDLRILHKMKEQGLIKSPKKRFVQTTVEAVVA